MKGTLADEYHNKNYLNQTFFSLLELGRMAEDMDMSAKEICEVISNNKAYYKEIFDYWLPMKRKIAAFYQFKNPNYKKGKADEMFRKMMGL